MDDRKHNLKIINNAEVRLCFGCNEPPMKNDPWDACRYCAVEGHESCIEYHEYQCEQNPDREGA